jgi:hypothetical protein
MTDSPLITADETAQPPARRNPWLHVGIVVVVLALVAAGAGWWWLNARQSIPDWDRLTEVVLTAPAGDAFAEETPWVQLRLAPLRPGEENSLRVSLEAPRGVPVPASDTGTRIVAMTVQPLDGGASQPEPLSLEPESGSDGSLVAIAPLDHAGWWRFAVEVVGAEQPAQFNLLLPDPNINGPNAVGDFASSAEGEALFQRGLAATTALQSVRYTQWIADGAGNSAVSEHAIFAGGDGEPPAFSFRITGGMDAIIIGSTRWVRPPGVPEWQRQEGAAFVPPSEWGEEYSGATGFTLLGEETIDGETSQLVAFVAPELTEPRRRTVAWYLWWVGTETGQVRREAMVSRRHYMFNQFGDFNEPLQILPPDEPGTPAAGTPVAAATPAA